LICDSLQLCAKYKEATPVDWKQGENVIVQPSVKQEELSTLFPKGVETVSVPSGKQYLRVTPQPE
jgi:1-Cys peroxiredoxin 6